MQEPEGIHTYEQMKERLEVICRQLAAAQRMQAELDEQYGSETEIDTDSEVDMEQRLEYQSRGPLHMH